MIRNRFIQLSSLKTEEYLLIEGAIIASNKTNRKRLKQHISNNSEIKDLSIITFPNDLFLKICWSKKYSNKPNANPYKKPMMAAIIMEDHKPVLIVIEFDKAIFTLAKWIINWFRKNIVGGDANNRYSHVGVPANV